MTKLASVVFALILSTAAFAQQPPEETVAVPKSMLTADQRSALEQEAFKRKVEIYGKWVGLGKEIGQAVDGALGAVTKNANDLGNTRVGKFTMILVAWKILADDILGLLIGGGLFLSAVPVLVWSYRRTCLPYRVLVEQGADKTKKWQVTEPKGEVDGRRLVHGLFLAVLFFLCLLFMIGCPLDRAR